MENMHIAFSPPDITEEEIAEVVDTLRSGWITTGPKTKLFEKKLAEYMETNRVVCLNSATACLEMTLRLLGIGPGDEVITTAYTYTASASVVEHVGAKLILVDVAKDSYEMDYEKLADAITEIFVLFKRCNKYIDETAPWALAKDEASKERLESVLYHLCEALRVAGILLNAYLPSTAPKMMDQLGLDASALDLAKTVYGAQETYTVHKGDALFPRIDVAKEIAHLKEEDEKRKAAAEAANKAKAEAEAAKNAPAAAESSVDFTHEEEIDFDTFCKMELRVAEVRACENLKESKKLLHLTVFDGERERCILSGIAKWFKPEDLIGKKIGIVCNLAPRPMMKGKYVSEGMIFAADTADGGCSIAFYGDDTPVGSRIH